MLPAVVRFNGADPEVRRAYAELASAPEIASVGGGHEPAWHALIARLELLLDLAQMPRSLAECMVDPAMIPGLAEEAARQWTATFNPRPVRKEDFVTLYEEAFEPRAKEDH
jgi:alcohol dehydrogenase